MNQLAKGVVMSFNFKANLTMILITTFLMAPQLARADDWGCQVALCMANPAGPTAVSECVPVMQRLYNALKNKRPWPTCDRAQAPAPQQFFTPQDYGTGAQGSSTQTQLPLSQP